VRNFFRGRKRDARRQRKKRQCYYHINLFHGIPQWTFWSDRFNLFGSEKIYDGRNFTFPRTPTSSSAVLFIAPVDLKNETKN